MEQFLYRLFFDGRKNEIENQTELPLKLTRLS